MRTLLLFCTMLCADTPRKKGKKGKEKEEAAKQPIPSKEEILNMQKKLMSLFVLTVDKEVKPIFTHNRENFCPTRKRHGWDGVHCQDGIVLGVSFRNIRAPEGRPCGNFRIFALPSTVQSIDIVGCEQNYRFNSRALPRDSRNIRLCRNLLIGQLPLQTLPKKLHSLNLAYNALVGKVFLVGLPRTLTRLDLYGNSFDKGHVYYAHLPRGLSRVSLPQFFTNSKKLRRLDVEKTPNPDFVARDNKILRGLKMNRGTMESLVHDACK